MLNRTQTLSILAAVALTVLPLTNAGAAQAFHVAAFDIPAVAGAMNESRSLARSADDVRAQGGFATAGSVRWLARAPEADAPARSAYVPSVIGAMHESRGLARSADDVRSQGGFATAGAIRWFADAPVALKLAGY